MSMNGNGNGPTPEEPIIDSPAGDALVSGRPAVELSKTASGKYVWKVRAYGLDDSPEALVAAKDLVVRVNRELTEVYPG